MMKYENLILASKSPRRREFFTMLGLDYTVRSADIDETLRADLTVRDAMRDLAGRKALACDPPDEKTLIVSADTVVLAEDKILGKPKNREDALNMMRGYSNKAHEVMTAFAIRSRDKIYAGSVSTKVYFREMTEEEIAFYVDTAKPYDKAGAYAIQGGAHGFVESFEGPYENVIGFPVDEIRAMLGEFLH